ncbi:glycoside hydrolase family 5 protein, partial [bacterium]
VYELWNEPTRVTWSGQVKPYSERVLKAIREIDKDNLVLVGSPTWSQDVDVAAADPIKDVNVAYTLHFYAGTHKQGLRDKADKALSLGAALFVSEWGTCDASGNGGFDPASTAEWMAWIKKNGLSHCNWSVADKVETASIIKPGASPTGGWKDDQLTESGKLVRDIVRGWGG